MVSKFRHDHLRQQTRSRRALLNRLGRLGRRGDGAAAGVLDANVFDHQHLRRNVFVALADFLADLPQVFVAGLAVLFAFGQIVHDAFALQMPGNRTATARVALG